MRHGFVLYLLFFSWLSNATPLSSSVLVFNEWDYERCAEQVKKAKDLGNLRVQILFTLHAKPDRDGVVREYCFHSKRNWCQRLDSNTTEMMRARVYECVGAVVDSGMELSLSFHLDDGSGMGFWRNDMIFDPLARVSGQKLSELFYDPMIELIRKIWPKDRFLEWSIQGEMGRTLAEYPQSYLKLLGKIRKKLSSLRSLSVGISVNFNKIFGLNYNLSLEEKIGVQKLLDQVDFIGVSAYHPYQIPITLDQFGWAMFSVRSEMERQKLRLRDDIPIRFSEVGIGGSTRANDGRTLASTPQQAASAPYAGIYGSYSTDKDPWRNEQLSLFRKDFFSKLLEYLSSDLHTVQSAYLWNANSWDVQGLYPISEGYKDSEVSEQIRGYHERLR